jgi:hypothetical protein
MRNDKNLKNLKKIVSNGGNVFLMKRKSSYFRSSL